MDPSETYRIPDYVRASRADRLDAVPDEESGDFTPAVISDWREVPSDALERKELRQLLQAAIQALPTIYREVLADVETPVSALLKLGAGPGSFLLESVEGARPKRGAPPITFRRRCLWFACLEGLI